MADVPNEPQEQPVPKKESSAASFWALLILLVTACAILIVLQRGRRNHDAAAYLDLPLPPLEVGGWLNSKTPLKPADLRGKVVLFDFWASDCMPCIEQVPHLIELYDHYHDKGFTIVGLTSESGYRFTRLKGYVETHESMVWPIGYDARLAYDALDIYATPTYVLYDRSGRSIWGGHSLADVEEVLRGALAEPEK